MTVIRRKIASGEDWYQATGITDLYKDFLDVLEFEVGMHGVWENYYEEQVVSRDFRSRIYSWEDFDSRTKLVLEITIHTSGGLRETKSGFFGLLRLEIDAVLEIDLPDSDVLPEFIVKLLRKAWWNTIYEHQFDMWEEKAEERLIETFRRSRAYLKLTEPVGRTKRLYYEPFV